MDDLDLLAADSAAAVYACPVELLEREEALATLADAHDAAARGTGRVVFVTGEPGIGKTSLVTRFVEDLARARACSPARATTSRSRVRSARSATSPAASRPALADAIAGGARPHEVQTLLVEELEQPPRPTVLVLEDVHWADDATFDSITVLGRRIGSLPALLVLTFRGRRGARPGIRSTPRSARSPPAHSLFVELAPLSRGRRRDPRRRRRAEVYAASGGNPFYVNELLCSRTASELPPSVTNAVLGRAARLDPDSRRLVELVSVVPNRMPAWVLDAVLPGWPEAAEEPERRQLLSVDANARPLPARARAERDRREPPRRRCPPPPRRDRSRRSSPRAPTRL